MNVHNEQKTIASKRTRDYLPKIYPEYADKWLVPRIAVRAKTVNVPAHRVGYKT